MCGITGFTNQLNKIQVALIDKMTTSLTHRGPDQLGWFEATNIALGAVRLKVIDLDGGTQPFHSDDGDFVIVFNGELYNHKPLRNELKSLGHQFHSTCDTEVVLHAYMEWDTKCFSKFRGMFGVALWQVSKRRLVLARDRMGIKPLYFTRSGDDLIFGSELKAIFAHPEVERYIDPVGLDSFLSLNYVPGPNTLVRGIEKLPPGCFLEWQAGQALSEPKPYWQLRMAPYANLSLEDAKTELDRLLRESISEHLIADVPLGVWASGGLDSTTMLHYASELETNRLKTFSVSFNGQGFDEGKYFREVATHYGTDHHEFDLNANTADLSSIIEKLVYYSDEPSADSGALPVWFLSKMSRRHVTVVLSGEGADELFGGYNTYLADRYARMLRFMPALARSTISKIVNYLPVSDSKIGLDYKIKRMAHGMQLAPDEAHLFWNGTFCDQGKRNLMLESSKSHLHRVSARLPHFKEAGGYLNRFLLLDQQCYLVDDILNKCDRMSMAHSLEVRTPFLDHRIVEFAASLPERLKISGGILKFVLRELMRNKVPPIVTRRQKEGFDIPTHAWFRNSLKELLLDTITQDAVERTGLFRWKYIQTLMNDHFTRRANYGYHLWGLLILFLWMKQWKIQTTFNPAQKGLMKTTYATR